MFRGSAFLPDKSAKVFECVIEAIAVQPDAFWKADVDCYAPDNIPCLLDFKKTIIRFPDFSKSTDTLITKIMLGVAGNVPAFDINFKKGFGVWTFGERSLQKIADYYKENSHIIDEYRKKLRTLDFSTGQPTGRLYTRAKVIDMIFFEEGSKKPHTSGR